MTLEEDNVTWTETARGFWERGLDEGENNYAMLATSYEGSGRVFFAIAAHISVQVQVLECEDKEIQAKKVGEALRKAWLACRYDYPTIASQIVYNPKKPYFRKTYRTPNSEAEVESWIKGSFQSVLSGQTGVDWANADPPVPKAPTIFVLSPPSSSDIIRRDLVLRSPHEIIDGIGTLHLWNTLIRYASQAYQGGDSWQPPTLDGSEIKSLSPPYRVAASIPSHLTEAQQRKMDEIAAEITSPNKGPQVISLPFQKGNLVPGKHQRMALKLSRDTTARLLEACRAAQMTVTHAFHAAIAMAVRDLQPPQKEPMRGRYLSYILRDERPNCREPYNGAKHAAAVYHSISGRSVYIDMDLPTIDKPQDLGQQHQRTEFLQITQQMKAFYDNLRNDPDHHKLVCAICTLFTPPIPDAQLAPDKKRSVPGPRELPSVSLSSLGKIDDKVDHTHGKFEVYEPWVTGEELGNGYGLFLGTFRGELCLSGVYNDAWHDEDEMMRFLEHCKKIVLEAFGL
ncbi:hypothetical protein B0T10DRAFT_486401 [Thelonectria olida]|uniref:Uncharacterized protein n=1 Tax=Thelonectria olida TaxID=1576542 RepID=A0A9P8W5F2_9HYPO|nr:hypothetical protein B0T10DRAFT_486401 [Thelonectria olida]